MRRSSITASEPSHSDSFPTLMALTSLKLSAISNRRRPSSLSLRRRSLPYYPVRAQSAGAHGPSGHLVQRFLRRPDGCRLTVRAVPEAISSLSAAVDDGE